MKKMNLVVLTLCLSLFVGTSAFAMKPANAGAQKENKQEQIKQNREEKKQVRDEKKTERAEKKVEREVKKEEKVAQRAAKREERAAKRQEKFEKKYTKKTAKMTEHFERKLGNFQDKMDDETLLKVYPLFLDKLDRFTEKAMADEHMTEELKAERVELFAALYETIQEELTVLEEEANKEVEENTEETD